MKYVLSSTVALCLFLFPFFTSAVTMTSGTYGIQSDSVNFAGNQSASASYSVEDTAGEVATGDLSGTMYSAHTGYQAMGGTVAVDTIPPTAPSSISTTALTSDRVEITWGQSTDNVGVVRYRIYRDSVLVADTATFPRDFVDTGLTANTTYTYTVSALDAAGNESGMSPSSAVTTLDLPATVVGSSGGGSAISDAHTSAYAYNFSILPNETGAIVSFTTTAPVRATLSYGMDTGYGLGTLSEPNLSTEHSFTIKGLSSATTYILKVTLTAESGAAQSLDGISFVTTSMPNSALPQDATHFTAVARTESIDLSWTLPRNADITSVKIMRSDKFYPSSPDEGVLVYNGTGESASDTTAMKGVHYYYTLFTQNFDGNPSSGSIADAQILVSGQSVATSTPLQSIPDASNVDPKIAALTLNNFLFVQSGDSLPIRNDAVTIDGAKPLTVALTYYQVPAVLKTIAVTLTTRGVEQESFTFILRVNADKTRYEATIAPLGKSGDYDVRVTVIDFKNQGLKKIDGTLTVVGTTSGVPITTKASGVNRLLLGALIAVLIAIAFILFLIKRKSSNASREDTPRI